MKPRTSARLFAAALALACAGWDTKGTYDGSAPQWISMFAGSSDQAASGLWSGGAVHTELMTGNEHAELAHIALLQLGWRDALYGQPMPTLLDLNASVWHTEVRTTASVNVYSDGDDPATPLTERAFPHPARWAGVADFSYTAYDWIDRDVLCPSLPDSEPTAGLCHDYGQWLGAAFNSSHFGEQATRMYLRLHAIALSLGRNAGTMRAALARSSGGDAPAVDKLIREAELWALAFEGYAQHFLQDRWSSGHMWSRYGSPEYQGPDTLFNARAVGGFSGLIHGAEAIFSTWAPARSQVPDALCSPMMDDGALSDTATPVSFSGGGYPETPAVGDYRLEDAFDGAFGAEYGYDDAPIDVSDQMEDMMQCSRAGWADVARGFGPNPDGTAGLLGLPIDGAATFEPGGMVATENGLSLTCFETWATNAAMVVAVNDPTKPSLWFLLDRAAAGSLSTFSAVQGAQAGIDLPSVGKAFFAIQAYGTLHPTGTDLADGTALPPVLGTADGGTLASEAPASYIEPDGGGDDPFAALPLHADRWDAPSVGDRPGRDRHTLEGYASGANARGLCRAPEILPYDAARTFDDPEQGLRWPVPLPSGGGNQPSADESAELARQLDACTLLADRLYDRTTAWYRQASYLGPQRELRRAGHGGQGAANAVPACEALEALPDNLHWSDPGYWEDNPFELHPGYVSAADGPYATTPFYGDTVYRSTLAWCQALPVVNVDDDDVAVDGAGVAIAVHPGFRDDGTLSFDPAVRAPEITLHGLHFGDTAGQVILDSERGCVTDPPVSHIADIVSWSDTAITIRVPHTRFLPDHYAITIVRTDRLPGGARVRSVGRARLDVQRAAFGDVGSTTAPLPVDVTGQWFAALYPFCAGSTVTAHRIHDCTGVDETACGSDGGPGTLLWADGVPAGTMPGPFAEHDWFVSGSAECSALPSWVVCMPDYPTSYGMVYHVGRTSTVPVTDTPRRWRWTLIWQRPGPF